MLLKFAHENKGAFSISVLLLLMSLSAVPLVLVFTQYDRLVRTKAIQLRETITDPATLRQRSVEAAKEAFKDTEKSLEKTVGILKIEMPTYATVSGIFCAIALTDIYHFL